MKENNYWETVLKPRESMIVFKHASNVSIEEYKGRFFAR
jgi:hypothetical protein